MLVDPLFLIILVAYHIHLCVSTSYTIPEGDLGLYCAPKANGGNGTCTPNFCSVKATEPDCVFTQQAFDYAQKVDAKRCKQCTQSTRFDIFIVNIVLYILS